MPPDVRARRVDVTVSRFSGVLTIVVAMSLYGCRGSESPAAQQSAPAVAGPFEIALDTGGPMKINAAPLNVTVFENGKPATDVDVSVELRMPETPAMGEMRTGAALTPAGDGHFRGQVDMMMAGQWNAIVRVKRNGEVVATHTQAVTAGQ
jgi:hypothetical protein